MSYTLVETIPTTR